MEKRWQGTLLEFPTHERRARARAELATARMQGLQALTLALSGALTPDDVARAVVEEAVRALPADAGILFLLQHTTATLADSLDAGQSLRGVALALVPSVGDFCIIDVRGLDQEVRRTFHALAHESAALLTASRWSWR